MITSAKAFKIMNCPMLGCTRYTGASAAPARPHSIAATITALRATLRGLTPTISAASRLIATARMARPKPVRNSTTHRAAKAARASPQATRRVWVMRMAPICTPSMPICVLTILGVDVKMYWQPYSSTIDTPMVIRMLRSKSLSRSRTSRPS